MVNGKVDPAIKLNQVRLAFDRWRRQRGGKGRIPERLWDLATSAARTNGIGLVSRELGMDFTRLKERVAKGAVNQWRLLLFRAMDSSTLGW